MREKFLFRIAGNNHVLFAAALLVYIVAALLIPERGHDWDSYCWGLWSERIQKTGFASVYDAGSPVNYPPLYLYVLKVYSMFTPGQYIFSHVFRLKYVSLLFDLASMVIIIRQYTTDELKRLKIFLLLCLNPALFYNSFFWNQVDGILSFFVLLAFLFTIRGRLLLAVPAFLLALNFKLQAIVFLPVLGLMWLPLLTRNNFLKLVAITSLIQICILFPFLLAGNASNFIRILAGSVDYFPSVSMNAFNFWHLIFSGDLMWKPDSEILAFGWSIKQTGLLLFFSSVLYMTIMLVRKHLQTIRTEDITQPALLSMILICFLFFYFNTQMHERYIHPALVLGVWAFLRGGFTLPWLLTCSAYLVSLDSICHFLLPSGMLSSPGLPKVVAIMYSAALILTFRAWLLSMRIQNGEL